MKGMVYTHGHSSLRGVSNQESNCWRLLSEGEACQQSGLEAPADGEKDHGEHGGRQRPAVGQLQQLDVAEDLGAGHHHGRLCQAADGDDGIGRTFVSRWRFFLRT